MSSCDCSEDEMVINPEEEVLWCPCDGEPAESVAMRDARKEFRKAKNDAIGDLRTIRADPTVEMSDEEITRRIVEVELMGTEGDDE